MNAAVDQPVDMPTLPIYLADPIIILTIRLVATSSSLWHPTAVVQPLNVLSRIHVPLATKVALLHMPHIDMNLATKCGDLYLLKLMHQWSKQPRGRPLKYDWSELLPFALKCDTTRVLEWWIDESKLFLYWDWGAHELMEAFCDPLEHTWLEWWKARGYPNLKHTWLEWWNARGDPNLRWKVDSDRPLADISVHASGNGRVDILDWVLRNAGTTWMDSAGAKAAVAAARNGHVHILEWWFLQFQARIDWIHVFSPAFSGGQVTVLEWCGNHPLVMEAWSQPQKRWANVFLTLFDSGLVAVLEWCKSQPLVMEAWRQCLDECLREFHKSEILSMFYKVLGRGLGLDWLRAFDMLPFADGNRDFTQEACVKGDLDLVQELHNRGFLLGSRNQLAEFALPSGNLELLKWIQANIDPSIPNVEHWHFRYDSYQVASSFGNIDVLDWLLRNGYPFPSLGHTGDRSRASVFSAATKHLPVLEWLFKHGLASGMQMEDWTISLERASNRGHIDVLDWLAKHIPEETGTALPSTRPIPLALSRDVFSKGRVDVVEWWLHKSGWLKHLYDLNHGHPYRYACDSRCGCEDLSKAALKVWYDAGQPMDFAACIHAASINGRVDVLDWLLRSTSASEQDFVRAWSSNEFPDKTESGNMYAYDRGNPDKANHAKSLAWWRANLPNVAKMPVNRGPYCNPVHAHYMQYVLSNRDAKFTVKRIRAAG
ncbi:hypothetical protein BCR44DRAFT_38636 [Catenaria anguillulae PL171]|uniref:Ankyrin repeat-containing domain protein n=1 Tax=Catenaria anguillulae PL171 TaxID=765915 RepID=A0A1Y2H6B9_9FUNG|nr:hypothetical protein BCR44DRAFT_38636 [Catenaria anguillulae PL171]